MDSSLSFSRDTRRPRELHIAKPSKATEGEVDMDGSRTGIFMTMLCNWERRVALKSQRNTQICARPRNLGRILKWR
jgi:hypothetical protein